MKGPNIEIEIEELVLHGFGHKDRYAIADAVERGLVSMLAHEVGRGIPSSLANSSEYGCIDAGGFHVAHGSKADSVGAQIAQAVYGGLSK